MRPPPVADEGSSASGSGRCATQARIRQGAHRAPQQEKLIGAVTHVLVNDPTTGYGIFIENMLDSAA